MKLKLLRSVNRGQNDMVFQAGAKTYALSVGEHVSLSDADAKALMAKFPGCFSLDEAPKEEPKKTEETKVVKTYETKVSTPKKG